MRDLTPTTPPRRNPGPKAQRGFTLVELLIAMAAGVVVAAAAFLMSKNATKFFQNEARISATQLAVTLGMNRITSDLQRAGFLSSPNLPADPARCQGTNWPAGLTALAAIQITQGASGDLVQSAANGVTPDTITIGGAFDTTEQFPIRSITAGLVRLQMDVGPMVRAINATAQSGGTLQDTMSRIFRPGRFLRVVDTEGRHEYGVITGVTAAGTPTEVQIQLDTGIPLPVKTQATTCGISQGLNIGLLANPIARVRYNLRSLTGHGTYGPLVAPPVSGDLSGDTDRTELVRVELDQAGAEVASTLELVAEYAVDLKFGLTTSVATPKTVVTRDAIGAAAVYTRAASFAAGGTPQRIRNVQVRLSTRTRAPDRGSAIVPVPNDGRLIRFQVPGLKTTERFFRVRTLQAEVALPNMMGVTW
jgi:prepilin-type N-terminal cleavage/methylation domain-containing protein